MQYFSVPVIVALAIIAIYALVKRDQNNKLIALLQSSWGSPDAARDKRTADEIDNIANYWKIKQRHQSPANSVDDITWNDLDMPAIFNLLNHAQSNVGEEILYSMLRDTGAPTPELERRMKLIRAVSADENMRLKMQLKLNHIGNQRYHGAERYLYSPESKHPSHEYIYWLLASITPLCIVLGFANPAWFVGILVAFGINVFVYYRSRSEWASNIRAIRQLGAVMDCARKLCQRDIAVAALMPELSKLVAELKPAARWAGIFAMSRGNELDMLTEYIKIAFQLDMISLCRLTEFLSRHKRSAARLYELVGELDACLAIGSVRAATDMYTIPVFTAQPAIVATGLAHPLLTNPVRNSMTWNVNTLITGSNASGKSTFIKALALNAVLAQSVCTCWAEEFEMPRARVLSSMALRDNVRGGESYFVVEIKSLRRILSTIQQTDGILTLCFIDEILRGTNTIERIAASTALLRDMLSQNALCMAATHDIELTRLLDGYAQYHFTEKITDDGMSFPYTIQPGPSNTRNAIKLLSLLEFPSDIVACAEALAENFTNTGVWKS